MFFMDMFVLDSFLQKCEVGKFAFVRICDLKTCGLVSQETSRPGLGEEPQALRCVGPMPPLKQPGFAQLRPLNSQEFFLELSYTWRVLSPKN